MGTIPFVVVTHATNGNTSRIDFAALEDARTYATLRIACRDCDRLEIFHANRLVAVGLEEVIAEPSPR